jgi:hypothetical protein
MMLRASSQHFGFTADLRAIGKSGFDSGVPHGDALVEFSEAVVGRDPQRLLAARERLASAMSPAAVADVAAVAGNFQMMDRIANGCGIALDAIYEKSTRRYRKDLGMGAFPSAANSPDAAP